MDVTAAKRSLTRRIAAALAVGLMAIGAAAEAATPEESFRKSFPRVPVSSLRPGPIPGLYEILSGGQILYYVPGPEYLIAGSIHSRDGRNLTEERIAEVLGQALRTLPLGQALKIGSGPHQVIEVTDPDCPYCRRASGYLAPRKDLTRYIFFLPLPMHRDAEAKVRYIFCAPEPAAAYEEAMAGKLDAMKFPPCTDPQAEERLKTHKELLTRIGINSTPMFTIDGQFVNGADIPLMEKILNEKR